MSAEIIELQVITTLDIPAEKILQKAIAADLEHVVVVAWDKNGEFYFASSHASGPETAWLLDGAKAKLIKTGFFKD